MDRIGPVEWERFKSIIKDAHDTFFQDTIIWRRFIYGLDIHGEDNENATFQDIPLKCLFRYNDFKVWPLNTPTTSGEIDRQTNVVMFNLRYLDGLGYLDANKQFMFCQSADRIIARGVVYKSTGETFLSQAYDEPVMMHMVLTREEVETADLSRS